jgi:hypothetical protein
MALTFKKKIAPAPKAEIKKEILEKGKVVNEETSQETPEVEAATPKTTDKPWCEVGFEASYTHNLGNYQSARVQVSIKMPCEHAEIDPIYEVCKTWVNERMEKVIGELGGEDAAEAA